MKRGRSAFTHLYPTRHPPRHTMPWPRPLPSALRARQGRFLRVRNCNPRPHAARLRLFGCNSVPFGATLPSPTRGGGWRGQPARPPVGARQRSRTAPCRPVEPWSPYGVRFASTDPRGSLPRAPAVGGQSLSRRSSMLAPGYFVLTDFSHPPRTTTRQRPRHNAARRSVAWAFALRGAPPSVTKAPPARPATRRRVLGCAEGLAGARPSPRPRTRQRSARSRPPLHPGPESVQPWPRLRCCGSSFFRVHGTPPPHASPALALASAGARQRRPSGAKRGRLGAPL